MVCPGDIACIHCHAVYISDRSRVLDLDHRCEPRIHTCTIPCLVLRVVSSSRADDEGHYSQSNGNSDNKNDEHHPVDNETTSVVETCAPRRRGEFEQVKNQITD